MSYPIKKLQVRSLKARRSWFKMKILRQKIRFIIEKTDTGFSAYAKEYPIYTIGAFFTELLHNAVEATNLHLAEQDSQISKSVTRQKN